MNAPVATNLRALAAAVQESADQLNGAPADAPNFDELERAWLLCHGALRDEIERVFAITADKLRELLA